MKRSTVSAILVLYFALQWGAVLFRIDRFPLTWAPMYSTHSPGDSVSVRVLDEERMGQGIIVTHRDGTTSFVTKSDLNLPKWHFWRLYYERMFANGPNKFSKGNANVDRLNLWIRGLAPGEPVFQVDWNWRVMRSLNKTLGYEPSDPGFIVRAQSSYEKIHYSTQELGKSWREDEEASIEWQDEWTAWWSDGRL